MAENAVKRLFFFYTDKFSELCSVKILKRMKRIVLMLVPLLMLAACERDEHTGSSRAPLTEVEHGMIQLGEKLDDPYTVENMRAALAKVYPTKADRIDITATDLYVRFLPEDDEQMTTLRKLGLNLTDHPVDYRIVREGDYYQDPEVGDNAITWQYAVVPHDFTFPAGIRKEVLDECYISEHDPVTRADPDIDWLSVEQEAFRLTGNGEMWDDITKGGEKAAPAGRITIEDPGFSGGKPIGVAGVKVAANIFVKIAYAYTDRDGYYKMEKTFNGNPRYRLIFANEKGFDIGFNFIILPASVSALGTGSKEGIDLHVNTESDAALFRRCVVNNAAYDYYSRCTDTDLDITAPPEDLRIWIFPDLTCSSACMFHHGPFVHIDLLDVYIGAWMPLIRIFMPDVTLGTREQDYAGIYSVTCHELAHASHFAQVGTDYWNAYIDYVAQSFMAEGNNPYGTGTGEKAGYCEVGEMWAYFMQESLKKDRYGGTLTSFGNQFWFKPDILSYLYEHGISRGELFRALGKDITSSDDLREELIVRYPGKEAMIEQTFKSYGK